MRVGQSNTTFGAREFVSQRLNNVHLEKFNKPVKRFSLPLLPVEPVVSISSFVKNGKRVVMEILGNQDA